LEQEKPALNLEQTLKKIKGLSRLSNQREKLLSTIEDLEAFLVKQLDDAEETNLNHFQRCELKLLMITLTQLHLTQCFFLFHGSAGYQWDFCFSVFILL